MFLGFGLKTTEFSNRTQSKNILFMLEKSMCVCVCLWMGHKGTLPTFQSRCMDYFIVTFPLFKKKFLATIIRVYIMQLYNNKKLKKNNEYNYSPHTITIY